MSHNWDIGLVNSLRETLLLDIASPEATVRTRPVMNRWFAVPPKTAVRCET